MDTTSLDEQIDELEDIDPADAVDGAQRVAEHLEELLRHEEESPAAPST